jgi:hypothetical protein
MATRESRLSAFVALANCATWQTDGRADRGGGLSTYEAVRLVGSRALADFLEQLELESFRIDQLSKMSNLTSPRTHLRNVAADHGNAHGDGFGIIGHRRIKILMTFSAASSASDSDS